jgi:hypothetical protein
MSLTHTVYVGPYAEVRPPPGAPSWGDFTVKIRDVLAHHEMPDGSHVWTPNTRRNWSREMYFHPREEEASVVTAPLQDVIETGWFAAAYGDELDALIGAYGAGNVLFRWGVLIMTS